MGLLTSLFDRAKDLLSKPRPAGTATEAVEQGTLDKLMYERLIDEAPPLRDMVAKLGRHHAGANDLVRDMLMLMYQHNPKLADKTAMAPNRLVNWTVTNSMDDAPETAETRSYTVGDKYASALATAGFSGTADQLLRKAETAQDQSEQAEQAQRELSQHEQQLQEALTQAAQAEQGGDEGEIAAAMAELQRQVEATELAGEVADIQAQQAQAGTDALKRQMQASLNEAAEKASDELGQERELMAAWGIEPGQLQTYSFEARRKLMAQLKANEVSKHLQLLGRFKFHEKAARAKRVDTGREEAYDVERSSRLQDVLTSELAMLAHPSLETEFLVRYADSQLLTRKYRGKDKQGKGAVLCMVDTSGSMASGSGRGVTPAIWSKAFALALLQRCEADRRDFVGLIFGTNSQIEVYQFRYGIGTPEDRLARMLAFVERSFNGGTGFEGPFDEAVDLLDAQFNADGKQKGDIIVITDGRCRVGEDWLASYKTRKSELDFRTWWIQCGGPASEQAIAMSDNVRSISEFIDPTPVGDLLKAL